MSYVSLAELIRPFVDHPFDALQGISEGFPNVVTEAIERELWDGGWDSLTPWQRMHFAKDHDAQHNPANLRGRLETNAAFAETVYNGKAINWRYWVHQLPALTAGEASRLLCALDPDPDLFQDLENRPNRNDPSRHCKNALMIQRLAEREGKESATPAEWLAWADTHQFTVHDGFRFAVESAPGQAAKPAPVENTSPDLNLAEPPKNRTTKRRTWRDVSMPYVVNTYRSGKYKTAHTFYVALVNKAGAGDSPFTLHDRELFLSDIGQSVAEHTIANAMREIKAAARTGPKLVP